MITTVGFDSIANITPVRAFTCFSRSRVRETINLVADLTIHMKTDKPSILVVEDEAKLRRLIELQLR